ncbi:MAG: rhomboid family intramembrane serine protease [Sphingomicrobium sp.]
MNPAVQRLTRSATNIVAALTVLAFLLVTLLRGEQWAALTLGFIPARLSGLVVAWPAVPVILTPLSATMVHSGLMHLGFNLLILLWCGTAVERVIGKAGLVLLYVAGAFAAALSQWAVDPHGMVPMIGASGAISAVIGAYSLSFGRAKAVTRSPTVNRWINALWLLGAWIVLQLMTGYLAGQQGTMLATPAHIGGFVIGLLLQRPLLLLRYRTA